VLACGGGEPTGGSVRESEAAAPGARSTTATATPALPAAAPRVVFLGDSLTAGFGLGEEQAFPARVGELLAERGMPIVVVNGGVSGDTSAGALERVDWLMSRPAAVMVVSIGANDGLRGQPVAGIEANLRAIVRKAKASGARVLITGQKIPTNYGPDYAHDFEAIYPRVAKEEGAALLPFLLEGVAMRPELNQADGIHPTPEGQGLIARAVAAALEPLLSEVLRSAA
jgi:acyl-CoA thioesterase-1